VNTPATLTMTIEPCPTFRHERFADTGLCSACGWMADEHELYVELTWGSALLERQAS
jgi:hypothetical protein